MDIFRRFNFPRLPTAAKALCLSIMMFGGVLFGQSAQDEAAVRQFYPQSLRDEFDNEQFNYIAADLNSVGTKNYLVAAYSNGTRGAVAVLLKSTAGVSLVSRPELPALAGSQPELEAVDLDNDGKPEIVLSFMTASGNTADWSLKWNGITLQSIGPTEVGYTVLNNADYVDIDGDGRLEAINSTHYRGMDGLTDDPPREGRGEIYRMEGSTYSSVPMTYTLLRSGFRRATGAPQTEQRKFTVNAPGPNFRLRVVNGVFGNPRAASGTIKLNGVEVVSQNQLSQQVTSLTVPISVLPSNTIEVTLGGTPLGAILVLVLPPE